MIPTVYDKDDWWSQKRNLIKRDVPAVESSGEPHSIHLPQPSYWPLIVAVGLLIGGYGLIYSVAVAAIGGAIATIATYAWAFEPVNDPDDGPAH